MEAGGRKVGRDRILGDDGGEGEHKSIACSTDMIIAKSTNNKTNRQRQWIGSATDKNDPHPAESFSSDRVRAGDMYPPYPFERYPELKIAVYQT